jgi:hypothetical protein
VPAHGRAASRAAVGSCVRRLYWARALLASGGQFIAHSTACCEVSRDGDDRFVTPGGFLNFVPLLLGLLGAQPGVVGQSVTRLIVQDEVIMRVRVRAHPLLPEIEWVEKKGPKCIPVDALRGAMLSGPEDVDFIFENHSRVRAQFDENCPALDFYGSVYVQPRDERLCAGRDAIYSRMGASCTIEKFKQLVPRLRR